VPELPEVEAYRRLASQAALRRRIDAVEAPDAWFLKGGTTPEALADALLGRRFTAARRVGKLLLLDVSGGHVLGLRFGMTGRLVVDGVAGVDRLLYTSRRDEPAWDRFTLRLARGGVLRIQDPRRLGGVELDPDEARLGPDVLALDDDALGAALAGSRTALKARLLDQARVAGVGNLMADEALWRAGLSPVREAGSLSTAERRRLRATLVAVAHDLIERGGSHLGDVVASRAAGGTCPKDGAPLTRATVGGRTTWWCPQHQR
jgi:formamidopyrimidine-DNA glycosylase